jgi:ubiquinol-cytochrome c reductase subunit 7
MRRAIQYDTMRRILPKDQWTKPEEVSRKPFARSGTNSSVTQDKRYLTPYIEEAYKEELERAEWDNVDVKVARKAPAH